MPDALSVLQMYILSARRSMNCVSKQYLPILYSILLYNMSHYLLDILCHIGVKQNTA